VSDETDMLRRYAELIVGFGANVQPARSSPSLPSRARSR